MNLWPNRTGLTNKLSNSMLYWGNVYFIGISLSKGCNTIIKKTGEQPQPGHLLNKTNFIQLVEVLY